MDREKAYQIAKQAGFDQWPEASGWKDEFASLYAIAYEAGRKDEREDETDALEASKRVHKTLVEDGYYGPYVLGTALWEEFYSKLNKLSQEG